METGTTEQNERQRRYDFEGKVMEELVKRDSRYQKHKEEFQSSLTFGIGLPAIWTGLSYLLKFTPEQVEVTRQIASWGYMVVSPFIVINGMRMAREKGAYNALRETILESRKPGNGNIGDGRE